MLRERLTPHTLPAFLQPSLSATLTRSLSHLSIHCPQQKPTQLPRLPISHKGTMLAQPTARRWGGGTQREGSFHVDRGCSHTGAIFTHVYLDAFAALFVQRRSGPRLAADRFFGNFVLSRERAVSVGEPEGRARDPGRATQPPALNQRDARCVISHTNTHTHTD